jgi:hypothetical protein
VKAIEWIKKHWRVFAYSVLAILALLGLRHVMRRLSSLVDWVSPDEARQWSFVPGSDTEVIVQDPDTMQPVIVELPEGVSASTVVGVGLTSSGRYVVEATHEPVDRRALLRDDE